MDAVMRLLVLGSAASPHVLARAKALADLGHGVTLLSPTPPFGPADGLTVEVLRGGRLALALRTAWRLWTLRHDAVHAHYAAEIGTWVAALLGRRPLAISVMGGDILFEEQGSLGPVGRFLTRVAVRRAKLVTVKNARLRQRVLDMGVPAGRVVEVIWGVDPDRFRPDPEARLAQRADWDLPADGVVVFSPRILAPFYRQHVILEAFGRVIARHPAAYLVFTTFGAAPGYRRQLLDRAADLGIADRLRWTAPVPQAGMARLFAACDLVVSLPASDGFPQAVLEAMACGVACVVTDLPEFRPLLKHGENAVMVAPEVDGLAPVLDGLLADPQRRSAVGAEARKAVQEAANFPRQVCLVQERLWQIAAGGPPCAD